MQDVHDDIPIPPRGRRGAPGGPTVKARLLRPGQCHDVTNAMEANAMVQAIKGWHKKKTGYTATQRKLLHDGKVFKTTVVPIGEWFWRVWRMS